MIRPNAGDVNHDVLFGSVSGVSGGAGGLFGKCRLQFTVDGLRFTVFGYATIGA